MGKLTILIPMAIFNSYVKLPEVNPPNHQERFTTKHGDVNDAQLPADVGPGVLNKPYIWVN